MDYSPELLARNFLAVNEALKLQRAELDAVRAAAVTQGEMIAQLVAEIHALRVLVVTTIPRIAGVE